MTSVKKRSPVWEYFDISSDDQKFAVCLLCTVKISRGGEGKKAGTSAMKNHIKTKHPGEFCALNKNSATVVPTTMPLDVPGTSSSSVSAKKQLTMKPSFERKLLCDVNETKAKKYDYLIAEMIALDNEPFIVERTGFTRLLEHALPRYKLPCRTYITQTIIPDIYDRIYEKIKRKISSALAISVTSDIWSCLHNNASFLSFTAHWLSPEFKLEHGVLAVKPLGSHTESNMAEELNTVANRWDIEDHKIHLVIHDSGANMVKGFPLAEYNSARCFIDTLQRAINESLKAQPEVTTMIATVRRLVKHFNNSNLAQEILLTIQKELNLPEHQLVEDTNTRWNSTFYMIERLLEQKRAISLFVADHDILTNMTQQHWYLMEQYIKLLKPFEEITKMTSSGMSCISEVIPHVAALIKYLDKDVTEQRTLDLPQIRACLKAELELHFISLNQDFNYLIATYLDPRFKTNYLGVVEAERARQKIILEFIETSYDDSFSGSSCSTPAKRVKYEIESDVSREAPATFWDCFNGVAHGNNSSQSHNREKNVIAREIDVYLKSNRIDCNHDPYMWWSANATQYTNLTKFARIYLSAPCSSVYNERLFSEGGLVYEDKRNRLLPLDEKLVFIHHNLPLVQYEY